MVSAKNIFIIAVLFILPGIALAQTADPQFLTDAFADKLKGDTLSEVFNSIFKIVIALGSAWAVISLVYWGAHYALVDSVTGKNTARNNLMPIFLGLVALLGTAILFNQINPNITQKADLATSRVVVQKYNPDPPVKGEDVVQKKSYIEEYIERKNITNESFTSNLASASSSPQSFWINAENFLRDNKINPGGFLNKCKNLRFRDGDLGNQTYCKQILLFVYNTCTNKLSQEPQKYNDCNPNTKQSPNSTINKKDLINTIQVLTELGLNYKYWVAN